MQDRAQIKNVSEDHQEFIEWTTTWDERLGLSEETNLYSDYTYPHIHIVPWHTHIVPWHCLLVTTLLRKVWNISFFPTAYNWLIWSASVDISKMIFSNVISLLHFHTTFPYNGLSMMYRKITTVKPPVVTTSRKQPPLLSDQFSKTPKVSKSNHYIWNLL